MIKNYYGILGIERKAKAEDIKKAYRILAKKWHPDKHQNSSEEERKIAEEKFKEISEAYAVLSDPEKKSSYDLTGSPDYRSPFGFHTTGDPFDIFRNFSMRFDKGPQPPQPRRGQTLQEIFSISLKDALFGTEKLFEYLVISGCPDCYGVGGQEFKTCSRCNGSGGITQTQHRVVMHATCSACGGSGKSISKICEVCGGKKVINENKKISIVIPAGIANGAVLRLSGLGGRGLNGGPPGDVLLSICVQYPDVSELTEEEQEQLRGLLSKYEDISA